MTYALVRFTYLRLDPFRRSLSWRDITVTTFAPIVIAVQMVGLACCDREYSDALDFLSRSSSLSDQTEVWF
ncbi:hypothetical protein MYCTH_2124607 [Thermothelomyces thermophilus ATCC 42464]|uniref:Uncharacterized protein n=1 Tax=Thermothelomyces thermophilus (strain ATCC 42464 / BCRC 31852 / DSM 1799) TaxID=573729 RepID=G2Q777_THET4|nr:uncharacterized protein MYCTH_2124607 [Thermothelomyces thermophilus ATCC 42464]AEO55655.1 hypothetical protein MYCTH_2124607 [Thermothelomyces thermophilus ATCC 42464]